MPKNLDSILVVCFIAFNSWNIIILKDAGKNSPVLYNIPGVVKVNLVVISFVFIPLTLCLYLF